MLFLRVFNFSQERNLGTEVLVAARLRDRGVVLFRARVGALYPLGRAALKGGSRVSPLRKEKVAPLHREKVGSKAERVEPLRADRLGAP